MVVPPEASPRSAAAAQTRLSVALLPRPLAGAAGLGGAPRTLPASTPTPQQQPPASSPCPPFPFAGKLTLLLGPRDVDHVKAQRIAHDRIARCGRLHLGLQHRLPLRRRPRRHAIEIARLFRPAHLIT